MENKMIIVVEIDGVRVREELISLPVDSIGEPEVSLLEVAIP